MEIPLGKVAHEQHYRAVITTAVQPSGLNDQQHRGRQVAQWSMTVLVASQAGTAWSKVPVALVGDARLIRVLTALNGDIGFS